MSLAGFAAEGGGENPVPDPRDLRSPVVRVQSKVAEESTLWIHSVTLTPAEPDR